MRRLCGGQSTGSGSGGASAPSRATWTRCATSSTSSRGCPWLAQRPSQKNSKCGALAPRSFDAQQSRRRVPALFHFSRRVGSGVAEEGRAPRARRLRRPGPSCGYIRAPGATRKSQLRGRWPAPGGRVLRGRQFCASARTIRVGPAPSPRTSHLEWQPSPRGRNGARSTARERALSDVTVLASPLERLGSLARSRRPPSTGNQRANGGPGRRGAGARGRRAGGAHAQDAHRDTRSVPAAGREIKAVPPRLRRGDAVETRRGAAAAVDADRGDERRGVRPPPSGTRRDDARLGWFLHRWNAGVALVLTW